MSDYADYEQSEEAVWETIEDGEFFDEADGAPWEWIEEQGGSDIFAPAAALPAVGQGQDVGRAVSAVIQMIPSLVRAIASEEISSPEDAEDWLYRRYSGQQDGEAWGAIIGAIASAIPAIIPVVRNIVNSARNRSSNSQRNQSGPSRAQPRTRRVCRCRNVPVREGESEWAETEYYEEFAASGPEDEFEGEPIYLP